MPTGPFARGVSATAGSAAKDQPRAGATLLLYTDGLVERRREPIQMGLDRLLREVAGHESSDVDDLCDHILSSLIEPDHVADDIAPVAMRPLSLVGGSLDLALPAEPRMLVEARRALRQWLRDSAVATDDESEILVAGRGSGLEGPRIAVVVNGGCGRATASKTIHRSGRNQTLCPPSGRWQPPTMTSTLPVVAGENVSWLSGSGQFVSCQRLSRAARKPSLTCSVAYGCRGSRAVRTPGWPSRGAPTDRRSPPSRIQRQLCPVVVEVLGAVVVHLEQAHVVSKVWIPVGRECHPASECVIGLQVEFAV